MKKPMPGVRLYVTLHISKSTSPTHMNDTSLDSLCFRDEPHARKKSVA
jgi:hypothetical protein